MLGDVRELPFDPDSFDYVVALWPPMSVYEDPAQGTGELVGALMSIARERVVIESTPMARHLPERYEPYLLQNDGRMAVYDAAAYKRDIYGAEGPAGRG